MRIVLALLLTLIAFPLYAQTCEPDTGDGPVDPKHSAVKKLGDTVTISWTAPVYLSDCTPIADDPEFALTGYDVYVGFDVPADKALPPIELAPDQSQLVLTVDVPAGPGTRLYYAIAAKNQFGESYLSGQPWVRVGGPPGKPEAAGAN